LAADPNKNKKSHKIMTTLEAKGDWNITKGKLKQKWAKLTDTDIARQLEVHAGEELAHAIKIAKQIDYLGGMPGVQPKTVKTSHDPVEMLRADLENERETMGRYRERIRQAEAMGEFALSETLRAIIVQEQDHEIDLAAALGIEVPPAIAPSEQKNGRNQIQDTHAPRR
jgi:bacterioferritin (cytochrome b1)